MSSGAEPANSHAIGIILLIAITMILALLVLLMFQMPQIDWDISQAPAIFKIISIEHTDENGQLNFDSSLTLQNTGQKSYMNWNLYVFTYVDGKRIDAEVPTLNAPDQINDPRHHKVQRLFGQGAKGNHAKGEGRWAPGASLSIFYRHGTFHPGNVVMIEVYDNSTKKIISRHTYKA